MSWLSDVADYVNSGFTPGNPNDPGSTNTLPLWGMLAGLGAAATPIPGAKGMGAGTRALMALGKIASGGSAGAQLGSALQSQSLQNQMGGLSLQRAQAMQPGFMNMAKNFSAGDMPGSLSPSLGSGPNGSMTQADILGANMLNSAYAAAAQSGDMKPVTTAYQSLYEHNPQLAGAIKANQEAQTPHETPQGTYQFLSPPGMPGSLDPSAATSAAIQSIVKDREPAGIGPGNQTPAETPTPEGQQGFPGSLAPPQMGTQPAINPVQGPQQLPPPPGPQGMPQTPQGDGANQLPTNHIPSVNASQLQPSRQAAFMPPSGNAQNPMGINALIANQQAAKQPPLAGDGLPVLPGLTAQQMTARQPYGRPNYGPVTTDTDKSQVQEFQKADISDYASMTTAATNSNQMTARINDMADALKTGQAGTLIAQDPDLAQKAIAAGIITDKGTIKDVAEFQRFGADQMVEMLNQIKAATAGTSQSRIMNSEINLFSKALANPAQQPEAIAHIMAMAQGLADYNQDMVSTYTQKMGGLGNAAGPQGTTMGPTDFESQWASSHPVDGYINKALQNIGPLRGMPGNTSLTEGTIIRNKNNPLDRKIVKNGQLVPLGAQ